MDALKNFAYSLVATAPSPATSGTSLVVTAGQGTLFPTAPFDATIWPAGVQPLSTNAEIVRVTAVSTDTFTITRAQYGTTAQSITAGYQIAQTIDANLLNQLAPLTGATFTGEVVAPDFKASGLTGATAASRYVGATTNGAPVSGTFAVGDFIIDQTSTIWVCLVAGTPGTWWPLIEAHMVSRSATATATANEVTIFTGSTASQTISVIALPIDGATWTIINRSSVPVTAGFGASSMLPLGSTSSVTSLVVPVNGAYSFINYAAGQWYMTASNNLANSVGTLSVTNGGTGTATAPAIGSIPVASSTSAYTPLAIGATGTYLGSNGTTASWSTPTASLGNNPVLNAPLEKIVFTSANFNASTPATINATGTYSTVLFQPAYAPTAGYTIALANMGASGNQAQTFTFICYNGSTAYMPTQITVNGTSLAASGTRLPNNGETSSGYTTYYQNGQIPTVATANGIDVWSFVVLITGVGSNNIVLISQTRY